MIDSEGSEMKKLILITALLAVVTAACAAGDDTSSSTPAADDEQTLPTNAPGADEPEPSEPELEPGDTPPPSDGSTTTLELAEPPRSVVKPTAPVYGGSTVEAGLEDLVAQAIADLSQRVGVSAGSITVLSAQSVVWPDGSIGCPQPDMVYTQVQVDGAQILLSADGQTYDYHSGGQRGLFLCT